MTKIFSPLRVEFLLHCHCTPMPYWCETDSDERIQAIKELAQEFVTLGAIEPHTTDDGRWVTTSLGGAWVDAICNVEIPRHAFVDEHGKVLRIR